MELERFVLIVSVLVLFLATASLAVLAYYPGPAGIVLLGILTIFVVAAVGAQVRANR